MTIRIGNLTLEKLNISSLYSAYFRMSPRDQTIALVVAVALLVLVIVLPIVLAGSQISGLEEQVADGRAKQKDIIQAIDVYNKEKGELAQIREKFQKGYDPQILVTVESLLATAGIDKKVFSYKESKDFIPGSTMLDESSYEFTFKKISLQQLTDILYQIEHQENKLLRIKSLTIKSDAKKKQELDVRVTVSTFKLQEVTEEPKKGKGKTKKKAAPKESKAE